MPAAASPPNVGLDGVDDSDLRRRQGVEPLAHLRLGGGRQPGGGDERTDADDGAERRQ